jgi:hypothetical protein
MRYGDAMSMKRSRRSNSGGGRGSQDEAPIGLMGTPSAPTTWAEAVGARPDTDFKPYSMANTYARNDLVQHSKFGKGVVTLVDGSRVEVLFEDGPRKLGHGASA